MKDFSPNTCFLTKKTTNTHTVMVDFHQKMATSIEAVIEFKRPFFFN